MKSNIEKALCAVYENCTIIKDIHDAAYMLNEEYRKFWDWHSEESKEKLLKGQRLMTISNGTEKVQEGLFHLATGGLSFLAKKLIQKRKPTREEQIEAYVTGEDFTSTIKIINTALADMTNELTEYLSNIENLATEEVNI